MVHQVASRLRFTHSVTLRGRVRLFDSNGSFSCDLHSFPHTHLNARPRAMQGIIIHSFIEVKHLPTTLYPKEIT